LTSNDHVQPCSSNSGSQRHCWARARPGLVGTVFPLLVALPGPGRFLAAADRLVALWAKTRDPTLAGAVADAWIDARGYQLYTYGTVTRLAEGGTLGAESSVNKLFWSHLDVRLHETALDLLGPEAETDPKWTDGWLFSLRRSDLRRHRPDPARYRRGATTRPAKR
jgi:Acyl-CoA dehydrogenase, C-terminal domain